MRYKVTVAVVATEGAAPTAAGTATLRTAASRKRSRRATLVRSEVFRRNGEREGCSAQWYAGETMEMQLAVSALFTARDLYSGMV